MNAAAFREQASDMSEFRNCVQSSPNELFTRLHTMVVDQQSSGADGPREAVKPSSIEISRGSPMSFTRIRAGDNKQPWQVFKVRAEKTSTRAETLDRSWPCSAPETFRS